MKNHLLDEMPLQIGLDNVIVPLSGMMVLGDLGQSEFRFKFTADGLEVTVEQLVFGGEPIILQGSR